MLAVLGDTQGNVLTWSLEVVSSKPARLRTALGTAVVSLAVSPSAGTQVVTTPFQHCTGSCFPDFRLSMASLAAHMAAASV